MVRKLSPTPLGFPDDKSGDPCSVLPTDTYVLRYCYAKDISFIKTARKYYLDKYVHFFRLHNFKLKKTVAAIPTEYILQQYTVGI